MQPAVPDRLGGRRLVVPVALHHEFAAHQDLAVIGDPDLDVDERRSHGLELDPVRRVAAHDRRGFGLAVALQQPEPERAEEQADLVVERRAARHQPLQPPAEALPNFGPHQPVDDSVHHALAESERVGALDLAAAERDGLAEQPGPQPAGLRDAARDPAVHRLVEPGHGGHDGRAHLGHVARQLLDGFGVVDLGADGNREHQPGRVFVGVRQRQEGEEHLVIHAELEQDMVGALAVAEDRAMAQHHALGRAAGAGGVDQAGRVAAREVFGGGGDFVRRAVMAGERFLPIGVGETRRGAVRQRLHGQHRGQRRRLPGGGQGAPGERSGRDNRRPGAAIGHHMDVVADAVGRIGRHGDRPGGHDRHVGDPPFRAVLRNQHDPVAGRDPGIGKIARNRCRLARRFRARYRNPGVFALGPQQRPLADFPHRLEKHGRQVGPGVVAHRALLGRRRPWRASLSAPREPCDR